LTRLIESGAPACVSVREAEDHPYLIFRLDSAGQLARFAEPDGDLPQRRQDLPPAWCLNGAVYIARVEWFMRVRTFLSDGTIGFVMPADRSLDIDTFADIEQFKRIAGEDGNGPIPPSP
jgi:N-acylneuraminate cytidylyltransferase